MSETIDFTKYRKGSRTDFGRTIEVCSQCGRKGEKRIAQTKKKVWTEFVHKGHVTTYPLHIFHVDDMCSTPAVELPQ